MARIKPFKAVRPVADKVHLVASRSYVTYTKEQLKEKLDSNPFTFIHIINPDYNDEDKAVGGTHEMFLKVKAKYQQFLKDDVFLKDAEDSIYIYAQHTPTSSYTGIISSVAVEEYLDGTIKIHEATIEKREKLFSEYLDTVDFNAEPVLLSYTKNDVISSLTDEIKSTTAAYDFTTSDRVRHQLWKCADAEKIKAIQAAFNSVSNLYVADGHHRSASSANLAKTRNNANQLANSNWFMSLLIQEDEMEISGFHRLVRGFEKQDSDKFIRQINSDFQIESLSEDYYNPAPGWVHMYYFGTGWTKFQLHTVNSDHKKDHLDAERLSQQVLAPIMSITDLKNDKRVKFIPAKNDIQALEKTIDNGNEILFLLAAVTFDDLKAVADAGDYMPPKSTYIEPKLRSGLTIFEISDE